MAASNPSIPKKRFQCGNCGKIIEVPYGVPKPAQCPYCGAPGYMIHRIDKGPWGRWGGPGAGPGPGRGYGAGRGRGRRWGGW
ncbi:MAG: hypothetical protein ACTSVA_01905 [Candidatus Njordarchaeales archaeon]